jgi:hypothetical protein
MQVVLNIFGKLAVRDLGQAGLVCREWWAVSLEPSLWRSHFLVRTLGPSARRRLRDKRLTLRARARRIHVTGGQASWCC